MLLLLVPINVFKRILASGDRNNNIQLWDVSSGKKIRTIKGNTGWLTRINSLSFSTDGLIIASAFSDRTVKLWNVFTDSEIRTFEGNVKSISSIAISPDGNFVVSGNSEGEAIVWDLNTGKIINFINTFTAIKSVAFSPSREIIATATEDYAIRLWKVNNGQENYTLNIDDSATYVTFSPNGKIFSVGNYNKDMISGDTNTKQEICTLRGHHGDVNSLVFSPDGQTLYSGSNDKTIKVWRCE